MTAIAADFEGIESLPSVVPIFPLPGVLLLPRGRLPLNIFEKRYLQMTQDAMSSHRMIGMIQPADPQASMDASKVYPTGCLGRITSFSETPDSRILITLSGVCRFEITRELEPEGLLYRRVCADYRLYADDLPEPGPLTIDRDQLIPALKSYFSVNGLTANWDAIDTADNEALIICLAMACPFEPSEKQALLECPDEPERVRMMQALFEMAAHEHKRSGSSFQ
jgi:Lon protease-like protein